MAVIILFLRLPHIFANLNKKRGPCEQIYQSVTARLTYEV
jgi:hypothetical protein